VNRIRRVADFITLHCLLRPEFFSNRISRLKSSHVNWGNRNVISLARDRKLVPHTAERDT
jgi:hypothetical protein